MPGTYDEMSPRSFPSYPGGTSLQRWHRDLLRRAMESEGFTVYESEWWHFDFKDWKEYAIAECPVRKARLGQWIKRGPLAAKPKYFLEDSALKTNSRRLSLICIVTLSFLFLAAPLPNARAQSEPSLAKRIEKVMSRPEFAHANFGIEFYSLDSGKVLYSLNADKLFVPASTTKILTEGTLLAKLGQITSSTRASIAPAPSTSTAHSRATSSSSPAAIPISRIASSPTAPLPSSTKIIPTTAPRSPAIRSFVIKQLAKDVAAKGIRKIEGRVLIDTSLFADGPREGGTEVVMSSIMINDNVIDLVATPGTKVGDPVALESSPHTSYIKFINRVITTPAGNQAFL